MRILHVLPSINPATGGPATCIPHQLRELARLGHEVELFTTRWPEIGGQGADRTFECDGVTTHVFPATPLWPLRHLPYSRALIEAVREARGRFDLYHASSLWNPLITRTMAIFRQHGLPYAVTCHGMLDPAVFARNQKIKALWSTAWERANVEGAEVVHFTSEQEMKKARTCGWTLRRPVVMALDVDLAAGLDLPSRNDFERRVPQVEGREMVLFVGRINWVKNLDLLVGALGSLRAGGRDVVLVCVGPDSDGHRAGLDAQAKSNGVGDQVIFTGLLEGEALRAAYARADAFALVSRKENFGLAAADALAAGVPLVLSDGVDMGQGWLAPPVWRVKQEVNSVAAGIKSALDFSRGSPVPCAEARGLARREWGRSQIRRLEHAFQEVLTARRPTPGLSKRGPG